MFLFKFVFSKLLNMETKQIIVICDLVKSISDGRITLKEAKLMAEEAGTNPNSFSDYYRAWRTMLDGTVHSRSINSDLRRVMLSRIKSQYGPESLQRALDAFEKSIKYFEDKHKTRMIKDRSVLDSFRG